MEYGIKYFLVLVGYTCVVTIVLLSGCGDYSEEQPKACIRVRRFLLGSQPPMNNRYG